jgi:hypothetical protein
VTIAAKSSAGRAATRRRAVALSSSFSTCKISPPIRRRAAASTCERSSWMDCDDVAQTIERVAHGRASV